MMRFVLLLALAVACGEKKPPATATETTSDGTEAAPVETTDSSEPTDEAALPGGGYLKIYGMRFAAAVDDDGLRSGAYSISSRPEEVEGDDRALYHYRVEVWEGEQGTALKLVLVGTNGRLELDAVHAEETDGSAPKELPADLGAKVEQWHATAASQADTESSQE